MLRTKAGNTNFIVCGVTWAGLEPTRKYYLKNNYLTLRSNVKVP
jgi:hypothetical protein